MKPDAIDRELQEFLDGRMSEKARTAFENRLAQDRDLARRVATGREVGRALRAGDDEQVSLGFYTRARARFEASRRGRDWFRLLSWETAGLAAAVAIAGVLFLPSLFMSERPGEDLFRETTSPAAPQPKQAVSADSPAATTAREVEATKTLAAEGSERAPLRDEQKGGKKAKADDAEVGADDAMRRRAEGSPSPIESFAPAPPPPSVGEARMKKTTSDQGAPDAERRSHGLTDEGTAGRSREAGEYPDTEPEPAEIRLETAEPPPSVAWEKKRSSLSKRAEPGEPPASAAVEIEEEVAPPPDRGAAVEADSDVAPASAVGAGWRTFELPEGAVGRGEVRTLRTAEELARLERLSGGRLTESGVHEAGTRVVLVGARAEPFSCSGLSAVPSEDRYVIRLGASYDPQAAARWGCAIVIPDDGRSVTVMGPGGPESDE
jgi:hypothetical protein